MKIITATYPARNVRRVLDRLVIEGQEVVIERNHEQVARLLPRPARQNALEAMADLHPSVPSVAAATWEADSRKGRLKGSRLVEGVRDPWAS